jgi:hypothetical protein
MKKRDGTHMRSHHLLLKLQKRLGALVLVHQVVDDGIRILLQAAGDERVLNLASERGGGGGGRRRGDRRISRHSTENNSSAVGRFVGSFMRHNAMKWFIDSLHALQRHIRSALLNVVPQ